MNYDTYRRDPRRARRRMQRRLRFILVVVTLLLVSWLISMVIDRGKKPEPVAEIPEVIPGESIIAPLPFQYSTFINALSEPKNYGPVRRENAPLRSLDMTLLSQPAVGQVTTAYFADAAFLGDSITEGFTEYNINMSGALICGYIGASPNQVVNKASLKHPERGPEVALDVLAAAQPAKVYVLMGANTLTIPGNDASFLAYYGQMLDQLKEALPNSIIYVQSLTPVTSAATAKNPGLENGRLQNLNESLAQMAYEKGLVYLNLWEAFADENGELSADYAQPDGIHITISGYEHWVDYLCRHAVYSADNPWLPGSTFAEVTTPVVGPAPEEEEPQ